MTHDIGDTRARRAPQRPPDLFTAFPATTHDRLIVRYPDMMTSLTHCFSDAAERLADSYQGDAPDDSLLLPFLYLYRHAFELNLKSCIETAAACRVLEGDQDADLEPVKIRRRLQYDHGHRIMSLFDELDDHLVALGLDKMPKESRRLHSLLANTDPRGESFRYPASMPGKLGLSQDNVDFVALREALRAGFGLAQGALSMLEYSFENLRDAHAEMLYDAHEEQRAVEAEFAEDLRRDFENYY